jgi:hypothetical protein
LFKPPSLWYSQPSISMSSTSTDSTNYGLKIFGEKDVLLNTHFFFSSLSHKQYSIITIHIELIDRGAGNQTQDLTHAELHSQPSTDIVLSIVGDLETT